MTKASMHAHMQENELVLLSVENSYNASNKGFLGNVPCFSSSNLEGFTQSLPHSVVKIREM